MSPFSNAVLRFQELKKDYAQFMLYLVSQELS